MRYFIDPTIDCVFKAILSAPGNENLLVNFLNSILVLKFPIIKVDIINPYNERDFIGDKLSIVDIKASDANGVKYHIEVQLTTPNYFKDRMLYTWGGIYQNQISEGENFDELKPVISIWLLAGDNFRKGPSSHYHFQLWDMLNKELLTDHCSIHVLDLSKWDKPETLQREDFWLYFFKEAKNWKELPDIIDSPEMRQAMSVLVKFSEQERAYHMYQSRQDALRVQRTDEALLERAKAEAANEKARAESEKVKAEKAEAAQAAEKVRAEKAEAEKAHLLALLRKSGLDPNSL